MAESLKSMYDGAFLNQFAALVHSVWQPLEQERFVTLVKSAGWEELELKGRIRRITESLGAVLPDDYGEALDVLFMVDEQCVGFPYLFFPDFVEVYGLDHWELSMRALERFTMRSTAEFAIRPFIERDMERTMGRLREWAEHDNEHVRRLASEGCRPRLPWASALTALKRDPAPILPILEQLRCDPSLYVRKSVANNLNDMAKDHPQLVLDIAARWIGTHPLTDWIIRRGCRSLVKAADPQALKLLGYDGSACSGGVTECSLCVKSGSEAAIGGASELEYSLRVGEETGALRSRIELGVDYVKASGRTSQKRFLLADRTLAPGERLSGVKRLSWADLSTRRHYPGLHRLHLVVSGVAVAETEVLLHERS